VESLLMEVLIDARERLLLAAMIMLAGAALGLGSVVSAPLALGGAAGVLFLAVAYRNPALGLCLFVAITFFDRSTGLQSGGVTIVKLAGAALALVWIVEVGSGRREIPTLFRDRPSMAFAALLLVVWTLASALWAPDSGQALTGSAGSALRLAQGVLLLFIVFSVLRDREHVWWLVWAFIGGSVFSAAIGLFGIYGRTASVNDARLSGGFDDPNELAAVLVPAIILSAAAFLAAGRKAIRWLYAGVAAFLGYAFFQTDSQAGLVALGMALLLGVVFSGRARARTIAIVSALLVGLGVYYTFVTQPVAIESITSQNNVSGRESLWSVAGSIAKDHPIFGVGAGNFVVSEPAYAATDLNLPRADLVVKAYPVHNSYLQVLAEIGVVGLLAFLAVIWISLMLGVKAVRAFERAGDWELELLSRGVVIGTAAMLVAYFFATNQYEKQLWLLLGVGPALLSVAGRGAGAIAARSPDARKREPRRAEEA
jgi:putative inorganic carbon (HCO3(-)) transporter